MAARMTSLSARFAAAARTSTRSSSSSSTFSRSFRQQRRAYSSQPPRPNDKVKFWPFIAVIGLGTLGYMGLVNRRKDMPHQIDAPASAGQLPEPAKSTPVFDSADVTVVFVLGGPGAGKGTQCSKLVEQHGFTHLSAGDLLRAEQQRPGSEFGELIKDYIKNGLIVPMEVTIKLLENAMTETLEKTGSKKGRFLIDGFPRKMDQAVKFEESVCPAKMVLFFDCPEDVMEQRLLERGKTSGRSDDNAESIRKRFRTFIETSMPVVEYFDKEGKVVKLDATPPPDAVFVKTEKALSDKLGASF
ncbi:uridylate kinase [Thelonectria olida]|uniref:Uridylate kinase n=1 Tax=Thelonectria olida TaxID=1576542 RepID=A0A9P8WGN6_9HYPO|nr:uridylate kinase [Thelonectria olida]